MPGTNLFPEESEFTPRPAWHVIEAARRQYVTGELILQTTPPTRIFMRDGTVYFAERSSDGALAIRLMMEGVITREQMQRGTVIVNGVEHVGRMFEADPTIDRASVELCAELFTDDVMVDVADRIVNGYDLVLYRRHSSGIDRWYPQTVPVAGRPSESPVAPAPTMEAPPELKNKLDAPPITQAVPIIIPGAPPPPTATQPVPLTPPVTTQLPITTNVPVVAPAPPPAPASNDVDASTVADEVAEAIKRAFAGTGTGH